MIRHPERKKIFAAIALHFSAVVCIILSRTYLDLLFLSSYPNSWLPYFFMGQTLVLLVVTFMVTPVLAKGGRSANIFLLTGLAASVFLGQLLSTLTLPGFPFIFSLWLSTLSIMVGVIAWNSVGDAFDVRTFKSQIKWINCAGSLGGLLIGLATPVLINHFTFNSLLFALIVFLILTALSLLPLTPLPAKSSHESRRAKPLDYSLFKLMAASVFFLMIIDTCSDYALKSQLGAIYQKDDIGKFMGPFYGIAGALSLAIQLFGTNQILNRLGLTVLITVLPSFCVAGGAGLALYPGLWLAAILRMGENVFRYSLDNIGMEIAARPLPGRVRRAGKLLLKGVAMPLGGGLGAVILWLIAERHGLPAVSAVIVLSGLGCLLMKIKVKRAYQSTLKEAIQVKRFEVDLEPAENHSVMLANRSLAIHALRDNNPDSIRFGLLILTKVKSEGIPPELIYSQLRAKASDIRAMAARTTGLLKLPGAIKKLLQQLKIEDEPEIIWQLMGALRRINPEAVTEEALKFLHHPAPMVRAGAIQILIEAGDLDELLAAGSELKEMIHSPVPQNRQAAAHAVKSVQSGRLKKELALLLDDPDERVSVVAVAAIAERGSVELAPQLAEKLGHGLLSRAASAALIEFGLPVADLLQQTILEKKYPTARMAARSLAAISNIKIELILLDIAEKCDVSIGTVLARESARRAAKAGCSATFANKAGARVKAEYQMIIALKTLGKSTGISSFARLEIISRTRLAETRLLYWLSITTKTREIIDYIPILTSLPSHSKDQSRRATAIEFLDSVSKSRQLKEIINLFDQEIMIEENEARHQIAATRDRWLHEVLSTTPTRRQGGKMDLNHKVMLLRKTRLFADLPGEILLAVAGECETREFSSRERIFSRDDPPDGLYIVASGIIEIDLAGKTLSEVKEGEFFGEIGVLDDTPRLANATAASPATLLFLEREVFHGITEELPEVLLAVTRTVIGYLKGKQPGVDNR